MTPRSSGFVAGLVTACTLAIFTTVVLRPVLATSSVREARQTGADHDDPQENVVAAARDVLHLTGEWDLLWKDERNRFVRVSLTIDQTGPTLKVRARGDQRIQLKEHCCTEGEVNGGAIRFTLEPHKSKPVMFTGALVNGILVGTTDTKFRWMAMPHLD